MLTTVKQLRELLADKPDDLVIALNGYKGDFYHVDLEFVTATAQNYPSEGFAKWKPEYGESKHATLVPVLYIKKVELP